MPNLRRRRGHHDASIHARPRQDGTLAYRVMFRVDGRQAGETFDSKAAAEQFRRWCKRFGTAEARQMRLERTQADTGKPTTAEWCREHVKRLSGITDGTRRRYLRIIDTAIDPTELGQMPVDLVGRKHVTAWVNDQHAEGLSGKTILNRHGLLYAAMRSATSEGLRTGVNPCEDVKIAKSERKGITFLTHGEFALLYHYMPDYWKPLTLFLADTGARFSEATAVQVSDVHLDDRIPGVRIERAWKFLDGRAVQLGPPKTEKGRRDVSLSSNLVAVLRPLVEGRASGEFLFTTKTGRPVSNSSYRVDGWLPALKAAQDSDLPAGARLTKQPRIHDLRHSAASWLIADGNNLLDIANRLGHESTNTTTKVYGHVLPGAQMRMAATMEIALAQAQPELEG